MELEAYSDLQCYHYSPLFSDFVDLTIDDFVHSYGYNRIDVSAVECFAGKKIDKLEKVTLLYTDELRTSLNVPRPFANLLLFFYRPPHANSLIILGVLTAERYNSIINLGFLTAGDVNRWDRIARPEWSIDASYYQLPDSLEPNDWCELGTVEYFFQRALGREERALESGRGVQLDRAGFAWLCVLASMQSRLRELVIETECRLLVERLASLELDSDRVKFTNAWFPGLLRFAPMHQPRYAGKRYDAVQDVPKYYTSVLDHYAFHRPSEPSPTFCFVGSLEHAVDLITPECPLCGTSSGCSRLPSSGGEIVLGYAELPRYLSSALRKLVHETVAAVHTTHKTMLAESVWFSEECERKLLSQFRWAGVAADNRPKKLKQVVERARAELDQFSLMERWFIEEYALGKLSDVDESWETILASSVLGSRNQAPGERVPDPKLKSYNELVSFAFFYWPPCLARMIVNCRGTTHLHYADRRRVSALLKRFGYNESTAGTLFHLLFSETDVEKGVTREQFLNSKRGLIIGADYASKKTENLGISCATLAKNGRCIYVDGSGDIEDLAREKCRDHMNKLRATENLEPRKYPISSPYNYFTQRKRENYVQVEPEQTSS